VIESVISALKAFFNFIVGKPIPRSPEKPDEQPSFGEPKWLRLARAELGQAEIPGEDDNPRILSYYAKAGFGGIKDETVPWCAGFVNAMLESAGTPGCKSLTARSFMNWGKAVKKPYPGCIVVLWRKSPESWEGHTGFYIGETANHIKILGGNQGNKVSIAEYPKYKILGYREPIKNGNSRTLKAGALGVLSAGMSGAVILDSTSEIMGIVGILKNLGASMPSMVLTTSILSIICFCVIVWARWEDFGAKGK
jgi:uncharacterized protein (TIGR02594 family)